MTDYQKYVLTKNVFKPDQYFVFSSINTFFLNHIQIGDIHLNHSEAISQSLIKCTSIVCQHIINSCKNTIEQIKQMHKN